jgi:DNA replication protein DnaC
MPAMNTPAKTMPGKNRAAKNMPGKNGAAKNMPGINRPARDYLEEDSYNSSKIQKTEEMEEDSYDSSKIQKAEEEMEEDSYDSSIIQTTEKRCRNVIIYGTLGIGKSRISNEISGDQDRFKVSKKARGCTVEVSS